MERPTVDENGREPFPGARVIVRRKAASIIYDTAVKTEPKAAEEAKAEEPAASAEEENKD